jgi:hypothetical protein
MQNTRCSKLKFKATLISSLQKPQNLCCLAKPYTPNLSPPLLAEARADAVWAARWIRQRERIVRCEANAAYISISNGDYVRIASTLAVTVADLAAAACQILQLQHSVRTRVVKSWHSQLGPVRRAKCVRQL